MTFADASSIRTNDYFTRLEADDEDGNEFSDRWNIGELLCLASAVQRSGDKNWVSVSRSIKPFGEPKRPSDWYTPKNCALQYSKLLKGVEDFKKKSLPRTERETSEELLVKNLTDKRITELNWLNQQTKVLGNSLKAQIEIIESGEYDEHLDEILKQIEEQEKREEEEFKEWIAKRESLNATKKLNKCRIPLTKGKAPSRSLDMKRKNSPNPDQIDDALVNSTVAEIKTEVVDMDHDFSISTKPISIKTESDAPSSIAALLEGSKATSMVSPVSSAPPTSPLLTSLLRSIPSSNSVSPVVSYANSPLKEVKVEPATLVSTSSADAPRKMGVFLSPTKTVMAGISPLLTSLLKSSTSAAPTSTTSMTSQPKEGDNSLLDKSGELDVAAIIAKAVETSPRSSVPPSPRPTPASSPLLNSLLKNSPSAASPLTSLQLTPTKEVTTPKAMSSPQSFFNPTSALATAAAQQLAVATSLPQSHVFFPQQDSDSRKLTLQSSTATSACLSAPTLSKLLEMPPSTPGRLPPLPVVDTVTQTVSTIPVTTPEPAVTQSPQKTTAEMLLQEFQLQVAGASPVKKSTESSIVGSIISSLEQSSRKISTPVSSVDKKTLQIPTSAHVISPTASETKFSVKRQGEDITSQENIDILEAVCESINQAFEKKEIKQEPVSSEISSQQQLGNQQKDVSLENADLLSVIQSDTTSADDILNSINIEKLVSSDIGLDKVFSAEVLADISDLSLFEDDKQKLSDIEIDSPIVQQAPETVISSTEEDKANERKYFKSRKPLSDEDLSKKIDEPLPAKVIPKKPVKPNKNESESTHLHVNEQILLAAKEAEEATMLKTPINEKMISKSNETKPPLAKKPRLMEKIEIKENKELSEDETPISKRPGRKAKKGRKLGRTTPIKQDDPRDQYEFSESTEENSVGYQTTNTLCYMPRLKEDSRSEDSKTKLQSQSSEEGNQFSNAIPSDKKINVTVVKNKPGRPPLARKSISSSSEEKLPDLVEDGSLSHFGEDKLKWKEFSEKKDEMKDPDETGKTFPKATKLVESPKKKIPLSKRSLFISKNDTHKREKSISSDVEESSVCSRDSEDASGTATWQRESGETSDRKESVSEDVEADTGDSRMSSITADTDKPAMETEESESLQGSNAADFSPMPMSEAKDKIPSQFGKQDWFQGNSPKSIDRGSQSSEESDDSESWDNQSVSTNKSATHSASQPTRSKRKERETPQYKSWKKLITSVLREASYHKFANVFLQKVTNDVAPGYLNIVYRPMDLSLIKKNVDNGVIRTTAEVHRDILLMFQNAIMYNSSDHDVHHMAIEMQRDVLQQIHNFMSTEINEDENNDGTGSLRGGRSAKKVYSSKVKEERHEKE